MDDWGHALMYMAVGWLVHGSFLYVKRLLVWAREDRARARREQAQARFNQNREEERQEQELERQRQYDANMRQWRAMGRSDSRVRELLEGDASTLLSGVNTLGTDRDEFFDNFREMHERMRGEHDRVIQQMYAAELTPTPGSVPIPSSENEIDFKTGQPSAVEVSDRRKLKVRRRQ